MKRCLLVLAVVVLLLSGVSASDEYFNQLPEWYFNDYADTEQWNSVSGNYTIESACITVSDGSIATELATHVRFERKNVPYVAFRTVSESDGATVTISTSDGYVLATVDMISDGKAHEYIADMSLLSQYGGTVDSVVFSCEGEVSADRIGFFRLRTEAAEFLSETLPTRESPLWDFKDFSSLAQWEESGVSLEYEAGVTKFISSSQDPMMTFVLSKAQQFDAQAYPYFAVRANVKSDTSRISMFFTTDTTTSFKHKTAFYDTEAQGWQTIIMNMNEVETWKGTVTKIRLDAANDVGEADLDAVVYLDKAGFFATEQQAVDFLNTDIAKDPAGDAYIWDFSESDTAMQWNKNQCSLHYADDSAFVKITGTDPYITYNASSGNGGYIDADKFKWAAVRMAIQSTAQKPISGEWFYEDVAEPDIIAPSHSGFVIPTENLDENWHVYKVELADPASDSSENYKEYQSNDIDDQLWKGDMKLFRLDPINSSYTGYSEKIFIDTIALFETEEQLDEYFEANPKTNAPDFESAAIFNTQIDRNSLRKITFFSGFDYSGCDSSENTDFSDYTTFVGTPSNGQSQPLVMFKADDETEYKPIALSYVTQAKHFPNFAAKEQSGSYRLGFNAVTLNDISSHWAKEYIEFVAEREIMGGTDSNIFSPDMPLTRAMFITALGRVQGIDTALYDGMTEYTDVNPQEYYAPYVEWASEKGIISDDSDTFSPESPILRKDVAVIIDSYLSVYKYVIPSYSNILPTDDTASLAHDVQKSIERITDMGILKLYDDRHFSPYAIMTRAECAETMARLVRVILDAPLYDGYDEQFFEKPRIKITAWSSFNTFEFTEDFFRSFVDCGFNGVIAMQEWNNDFVFRMAEKYGINIISRNNAALGTIDYNSLRPYYDSPAWFGQFICDEPGTDEYDSLSEIANEFYGETGKIPFFNLLPMYASKAQLKYGANTSQNLGGYANLSERVSLYTDYCEQFVEKFDAPYICTDIYPLNWSNGKKTTMSNYLEDINIIAAVARENNFEFYCCFQTFGWTSSKRTPDEPDYRWQLYSLLSFGCTNLMAWNYAGMGPVSLVTRPEYKNTQAYYDLKPVLAEVNAISDVFMQYKNLGVFNFNYEKVAGNSTSHYLYLSNQYTDFDAIGGIESDDALLFGCFEKKQGEGHAFTVVNMNELGSKTGATVTFKADGTVTAYPKGIKTVLTPENGVYTIQLECGQGVFVTVD